MAECLGLARWFNGVYFRIMVVIHPIRRPLKRCPFPFLLQFHRKALNERECEDASERDENDKEKVEGKEEGTKMPRCVENVYDK